MREHIAGAVCTLCGRDAGIQAFTCPSCGDAGILDIRYDLNARLLSAEALRRDPDPTLRRYRALLPMSREHEGFLMAGGTPLYKANRLHHEMGIKALYIKDEGINPTASLKDRPSYVAAALALEAGAQAVACSSTGNAASSMAGQAARVGLKAYIFVPSRIPQGKLGQLLLFGATVIAVEGDYRDAGRLSVEAIRRYGWYSRNAGLNPHLVDGKKTVAFEIAEQLGFQLTDWVALSVGDGCTIAAVYKGFDEFYRLGITDRIPRLLGVQAEGCAPFVAAHRAGGLPQSCEENTLADSIAAGSPRNPVRALRAVTESGGGWITVTDGEILEAMGRQGGSEGVFGEPAGAAAMAGVIKAARTGVIKSGETVTAINSGSGLKDIKNVLEAAGSSRLLRCEPSQKALDALLKE